jgi:UDP-glucose 4-epimerase
MKTKGARTAFQPAKCLVTGGAGFIGSHVAEALLRSGHQVVCLDNLAGGFLENVPRGALFIKGDINDAKLLAEQFQKFRFDYIFHFGAFAAEGLSHFVREFTFRNNQCGTAALIDAAVNSGSVRAFVFASSAAVYGKAAGKLSERIQPEPCDPYGISKRASELDLQTANQFFELPFIIFRLHNVYGERQNLADPYRNVVGIFLRQLLAGKKLSIIGDGKQTRQFTHVSTIANIIAGAIDVKKAFGQIINLGSTKSYTVLELARKCSEAAGKPFDPDFLPPRDEAPHPVCSHAKARKLFGDDLTDLRLETGLQRMFQWASIAASLVPKPGPSLEIAQSFPEHWKNTLRSGPKLLESPKPQLQGLSNEQRRREFGDIRRLP